MARLSWQCSPGNHWWAAPLVGNNGWAAPEFVALLLLLLLPLPEEAPVLFPAPSSVVQAKDQTGE